MTATLEQLIQVRSHLTEEVLAYLDGLAVRSAELPKYYPAHLRKAAAGKTPFDEIRQMVQVVEDRSAFERWLAEERERMRAAGQDFDRIAYKPQRSLMEEEEAGERDRARRERPVPPPPFQWDENAGSRFKRTVILGDPGFGKTWLLRYEARRLARAATQQLRDHLIGHDQITLPIFVRLSELNRSDNPIEDALVDAVSEGRSAAFRHFVREKLATENCTILLDAWDEVPIESPPPGQPLAFLPHHRQRLGQRLDAFARQFMQPRLLLTSRIVSYDQSPIPDLPLEQVKELELLAFDTPQIESFVPVWFGDGNNAANQFLAMLRQNHQVCGLARIPLMLTLLCRVWAESKEKKRDFPTRRVELYDRCLRGLLRDWKIDDKGRAAVDKYVSEAYVDAMIELLQAVSYELFAEGYEQFSESSLRAKMIPWLGTLKSGHELYGRDAASLIAELKHDGILITASEHRDAPLLFLHRTFQEHLAASALAGSEGWHAIETIVSKKAWLPEWQQVIVLLAGKLDDPLPLLDMLSDPNPTETNEHGDDLFRHRLALAAQCLPEVKAANRQYSSDVADQLNQITTAAFFFWWDNEVTDAGGPVPHFRLALPALGQVNGIVSCNAVADWLERAITARLKYKPQGLPLLDLVGALLNNEDSHVQCAAARVIEALGAPAATPEILAQLPHLSRHEDWPERYWVARAIRALGASAATLNTVSALTHLLRDVDGMVQYEAVRAIRTLGAPAATSEIILVLAQLLFYDKVPDLGSTAEDAIRTLGVYAATPGFLAELAHLLHHEDLFVRCVAVRAIGALGAPAATPGFLAELTHLLRDENTAVRIEAVHAIGALGALAATPEILADLVHLSRDGGRGVQSQALEAIGALGRPAATPEIVSVLTHLLRDEDQYVRSDAARAIGSLGAPAATPEIISTLAHLLRDEVSRARFWAAHAIKALGAMAATPIIISALAHLLRDEGSSERSAAAEAIGALGAPAATPEIISAFAHLLRDEDKIVRSNAARAIGYLGASVITPDIISALVHQLRDKDQYVQSVATEAIGALRAPATTPEIISALVQLWGDEDWEVRSAVTRAIGALGAPAATPHIISALALLLSRGPYPYVRSAAAEAIGALGAPAATPEVISALAHSLRNKDRPVRSAAAEAIARLMAQGVRIFKVGEGKFEVRSVGELSQ